VRVACRRALFIGAGDVFRISDIEHGSVLKKHALLRRVP
jgi:hypothetical protein